MKFLWLLFFLSMALVLRLLTYEEGSYRDGQKIELESYITESPEIHSGRQVFHVKGLRVATDLVPGYSYGEKIRLVGIAERKEFEADGKLAEYWEVRDPMIKKVRVDNQFLIYASQIRNTITDNIRRSLPFPESDLLVGIVLGDDSGFDKKTSEIFAKTGLMHIVAASGTNITIVGGLFYFSLLHLLGLRRALLISIAGIFIYALLAGFSPSIQRAALMGGISYFGLYLGRQTYSIFTLILTGFTLTLINPSILQDIGFHLSFVATAGIILIHPIIQTIRFFSHNIILKDISVTLSAYLALIPLLLYHFNTFTPFSVVINAFVLWTIPIVTIIGGIGSIASLILLFLAIPIFWVTYPFLHYMLIVAEFFSGLFPEYGLHGTLSLYFVIGYYILLLSFLIRFRK